MSTLYHHQQSARSYDKARLIPGKTMQMWLNLLVALIPSEDILKILDLGCGTGRFSTPLSNKYHCPVVAVDPSDSMLNEGKMNNPSEDITWLQGTAENLPVESDIVHLVWMSQVFHHLDDREKALREIVRVTRKDGYVAIRNGMKEHIDEIMWYECFPEAVECERKRLLTQEDMITLLSQYGFTLHATVRLYQYFAESYHEYLEKISGRGLSSLIAISDQAFMNGLERLKKWVRDRPKHEPVYEPVDLLIFQKRQHDKTSQAL